MIISTRDQPDGIHLEVGDLVFWEEETGLTRSAFYTDFYDTESDEEICVGPMYRSTLTEKILVKQVLRVAKRP